VPKVRLNPVDRSWQNMWFEENHRPSQMTSFDKSFDLRLEAPLDRIRKPADEDEDFSPYSPFIVRSNVPRTWTFEISGAMKSLTFQSRRPPCTVLYCCCCPSTKIKTTDANDSLDDMSSSSQNTSRTGSPVVSTPAPVPASPRGASTMASSQSTSSFAIDTMLPSPASTVLQSPPSPVTWENNPARTVYDLKKPAVSQRELNEYTRYVCRQHRFPFLFVQNNEKKKNRYVNEFSPEKFNTFVSLTGPPSATVPALSMQSYNSREYLLHLRRSSLYDYNIPENDINLYQRNISIRSTVRPQFIAKDTYVSFADYLASPARIATSQSSDL